MTRSPLMAPVAASELMPSLPLCRYLSTGLARFMRASNGPAGRGVCAAAARSREVRTQMERPARGGCPAGQCPLRSDDRQANVDIAARGVGVRAHLVRLLDQRLGFSAGKARQ